MAISISEEYAGRSTAPDASYPSGSFKNRTNPTAKDGTPVEKKWANSLHGFGESLLSEGGETANGIPDSVLNPQYLRCAKKILKASTKPPQITKQAICSGAPSAQWTDPTESPNFLATFLTIRDSCVSWDAATDTPQILVATATGGIYAVSGCWDYSTDPTLGSAIAFAYPTTPAEVCCVCSDADYVYVAWVDSSDNIMVSKFNATTHAAIWTRDTTLDHGAPTVIEAAFTMTVAPGANVVLLVNPVDPSTGQSYRTVVSISKATGALVGSGTGSYVSLSGDYTDFLTTHCVTDGDHVFWIGYDVGVDERTYYLLSASIANPSTSDYDSVDLGTYVWPSEQFNQPKGLLMRGNNILVSSPSGIFRCVNPGSPNAIRLLISLAANWDFFNASGEIYGVEIGGDGLNAWAHLIRDNPNHLEDTVLLKIPLSSFGPRSGYTIANADVDFATIPVVHINADSRDLTQPPGKILFDGFDLWFIQTGGTIYRVCNPGMR